MSRLVEVAPNVWVNPDQVEMVTMEMETFPGGFEPALHFRSGAWKVLKGSNIENVLDALNRITRGNNDPKPEPPKDRITEL